jgi:peptidoglycan/xylan/chitin deacetylase (PgdA/CDA1 family)
MKESITLDSYKQTVIENSLKIRSRRMKFLKISITIFFWIIAIIPWIFCFYLYKQVGMLKAENSELYNYGLELSMELEGKSLVTEMDNNGIEADPTSGNNVINQNKFIDKKVYLTFDDGPSIYTNDILDILNKYNVKATFFVIGKTDEDSLASYKRIVKEGHTLGMHSYSHNYNIIYNSLEDFDKDFTKLRDLLYDTTGYLPNLYRFPGGSANLAKKSQKNDFINYLNAKSVTYFDWNAVNGDATGVKLDSEQLVANVISGVELYNHVTVLMHDTNTKEATVHSLEELIKTLTSQGASLLPLDDTVKPVQQVKIKSDDK